MRIFNKPDAECCLDIVVDCQDVLLGDENFDAAVHAVFGLNTWWGSPNYGRSEMPRGDVRDARHRLEIEGVLTEALKSVGGDPVVTVKIIGDHLEADITIGEYTASFNFSSTEGWTFNG